MESLSTTVKNIKNKMVEFSNKHQQVLEMLEIEQKKSEDLEKQIEQLKNDFADLENKNNILKIAGQSNSGDNREIKLKINELVREVDKCIAQFNK